MVETVFSLNILSAMVLKANVSIQVWLQMNNVMGIRTTQKSGKVLLLMISIHNRIDSHLSPRLSSLVAVDGMVVLV